MDRPFILRFLLNVVFSSFSCLLAASGDAELWKQYRDAAQSAWKKGDLEAAERNWESAVAVANEFRGNELRALQTFFDASSFYVNCRAYARAEALLQLGLKRLAKPVEDEKLFKALFLQAAADVSRYKGDFAVATDRYGEALKYIEERLHPHHPLVVSSLHGLGSVHISRKEYGEAESVLGRALKIAETPQVIPFVNAREFGHYTKRPEARLITAVQNMLGLSYLEQQKYRLAERQFRDAIKTIGQAQGRNSPELVAPLVNLARAQQEQGKSRDMEENLKRAMEVTENAEGALISYCTAASRLAAFYQKQGQEAALRILYKKLLTVDRKGGEPKRLTSAVLSLIGEYQGDWNKQRAIFEDAIDEAKIFGDQRQELSLLKNASDLAINRKQKTDAVSLTDRLMVRVASAYGSESSAMLEPQRVLAALYAETGQLEEAAELHARQVALAEKLFGNADSRLANVLDERAAFLEKEGKMAEANAEKDRANEVRLRALDRP